MDVIIETEDKRDKIIWIASGDKDIQVVETKKGFSRSGNYHPINSGRLLISGQIVYRERTSQMAKRAARPSSL